MGMNRMYALAFLAIAVICSMIPDRGLLGAAQGQVIEPGHTALWYAPERSGEGWMLEILDSQRALVYWFTYDEGGGQRWLMGVGEIQGSRIVFPELIMPHGGRFGQDFDPDEVVREVVGEAVMTFDDCSYGSIEYEAFGQSQVITFQRLSRTAGLACEDSSSGATNYHAGFTGTWYDPSHSGEGYVFQWMDNGEAMVIWFTYDTQGNPYWILAVGEPDGDEIVFSDMRATRGTRFGHDFDAGEVERFPWGELRLSLDCDSGTANYASILPEFGSGRLGIIPLTRPESIICEIAPNVWSGHGPFGGAVELLEVSPDDPNRIYAVGPNGLFRSDDEGVNWRDISKALPNRRIGAVAADPNDVDVIYAAAASGLFKSSDGGMSWHSLEPDPDIILGGKATIDINPDQPLEITVGFSAHGGIYRSNDGGDSWTRLDGDFVDGVISFAYWPGNRASIVAVVNSVFSGITYIRTTNGGLDWSRPSIRPSVVTSSISLVPVEDSRVIFAMGRYIFETDDEGDTWSEHLLNCPQVVNSNFYARTVIADPADPGIWYVGGDNGVFRMERGSQDCTVISSGMAVESRSELEAGVRVLRFKPGSPDVLLAGTAYAGFFRSDDAGGSWQRRNQGLRQVDIRALAFHPGDGDVMYAGYGDSAASPSDRLWISADGGITWAATANGLDVNGVRAIAIDPNTASDYASTHLYAVGWSWPMGGLSGGREDLNTGVFKSVDGGANWFESGSGIPVRNIEDIGYSNPLMRSVILNPSGGDGPLQTLYVAGNGFISRDCVVHAHRIYKSIDAGATWSPADSGLPTSCEQNVQVVPLVIDPVDPETLYAGTFVELPWRFSVPMRPHTVDNGVFKSTDGGATWNLASNGLPHMDENDPATSHWDVLALAVAPSAPNVLYAAVHRPIDIDENSQTRPQPSMIFKTIDGGARWEPANIGVPPDANIRSLVVDPDNAEIVYAANISSLENPSAVLRTVDGGANWISYSENLDVDAATVLAIGKDVSGTVLHAGTRGGVFSILEK